MTEETIEIKTDSTESTTLDFLSDFPPVSKELVEALKEKMDIRKMIKWKPDLEYLNGVQDTVDFLEFVYKEQNKELED